MEIQTTAVLIQAVAAVVQAGAAVVLFFVTKRYVTLTANLSETSAEQLRLSLSERDEARERTLSELRTRAQYILDLLSGFPERRSGGGAEPEFRTAPLWSPDDVAEMIRLALRAGEWGRAATEAAKDLTWLSARVQEVRGTDPRHGFQWGRFNWEEWVQRRNRALEALYYIAGNPYIPGT